MKCPECQHDMIQAKSGLMCLNCGHAESTKPSDTPVVPPAPVADVPDDKAIDVALAAAVTEPVSPSEAQAGSVSSSPTTGIQTTDIAPTGSVDGVAGTGSEETAKVLDPAASETSPPMAPAGEPPDTTRIVAAVPPQDEPGETTVTEPGTTIELIPAAIPSETPEIDPAKAVEDALKAAGNPASAPVPDVSTADDNEPLEPETNAAIPDPSGGVADKLAEEERRDLDEALSAVVHEPVTPGPEPEAASAPEVDSGSEVQATTATIARDTPVDAGVPTITDEPSVGASDLIKTSSSRAQPADKIVDGMAPRGRQKGTLNLKPTQEGLSKLSDAALVDAIGPAETAVGVGGSSTGVTPEPSTASSDSPGVVSAITPEPEATLTPSMSSPDAEVGNPSETAELPTSPLPSPVHTIDHVAQSSSSEPAIISEVPVSPAVEAPSAPAVSIVPSLAKTGLPTPDVSIVEPTPIAVEVAAPETGTKVSDPVVGDVAPAEAQAQVTVPATAPASLVAAGVAVPPAVPKASPDAPAKAPLVAATHPTSSNSKLVIGAVAALLVITAATVGAYVALSGNGKKTGSTAAGTGQSVAVDPSNPEVLDASLTPEPEVQRTAETRDAQRKTDLAAYVAAVKASSSNGYYPTVVPQIAMTATDPSTGAPYVVSTATAVTPGQIQYRAGGTCVGPGVTPGKSSTRFVAFYTVLESSPTPYCIDVQ